MLFVNTYFNSKNRFNKLVMLNYMFQMQVDKEAIGLSRVQQCYHLCIASPYQISVNFFWLNSHY